MGQKKIKRGKTEGHYVNPELEEVDEDRSFELESDEDTNEILLVHHYRRKWGDEMDSDVEHGLNLEEAKDLVAILVQWIEMTELKLKVISKVVEKATPIPIEGNPLKDNPVQ